MAFTTSLLNYQSSLSNGVDHSLDLQKTNDSKDYFINKTGAATTNNTGITASGINYYDTDAADFGTGALAEGSYYKYVNFEVNVTSPSPINVSNVGKKAVLYADSENAAVDIYDATDFSLNSISKTTIPGLYTYQVKVDNLVETISINVVNPTPKVSVLDKTLPAAYSSAASKDAVEVATSAGYVNSSFVKAKDGIYTVEQDKTFAQAFKAEIAIFDVNALSTTEYPYSIVKKYPDGRVETISDVVKITSIDDNQKVTFDATNLKFINNWKIEETSTAGMALGKYEYEFTFNGIKKSLVINVVSKPTMSVTDAKIGTLVAPLINGAYRLPAGTVASTATLKLGVSQLNMLDTYYYTVAVAGGSESAKVSVKGVSSIDVALASADFAIAGSDADKSCAIVIKYYAADQTTPVGVQTAIKLYEVAQAS